MAVPGLNGRQDGEHVVRFTDGDAGRKPYEADPGVGRGLFRARCRRP